MDLKGGGIGRVIVITSESFPGALGGGGEGCGGKKEEGGRNKLKASTHKAG